MTGRSVEGIGLNAPRLIWLLAGLGLACVVMTVAMVNASLRELDSARSHFRATDGDTRVLMDGFSEFTTEVGSQTPKLLSGTLTLEEIDALQLTDSEELAGLARAFTMKTTEAGIRENVVELDQLAGELRDLYERSLVWARERAVLREPARGAKKRVHEILATLRAALASREGRARLDRIVELRRIQNAEPAEAERLALAMARRMRVAPDLSALSSELSDLAFQAERVASETEIDRLVDLKDNQLKASLGRLEHLVPRVDDAALAATLRQGLDELAVALFGSGYVIDEAHQTVVPGEGGLYAESRRRLQQAAEAEALHEQIRLAVDREMVARHWLQVQTDALSRDLGELVRTELRSVQMTMLAVAGLCAIVLALLAATIARAVRGQIEAIREFNRELDAAIGRAEAASQAKSEFLATMSHEIRTPLNGVLGMTELLLHSELADEHRRLALKAYQSGEGLLNVINDILDFSKVEAGMLELEDAPFLARQTIEDAVNLFAESAHRKGLEIMCFVDPAVSPVARGDSARLRQVLTNLIGNAVKFTARGEVSVHADVAAQDHDSFDLRVRVRDTGIGLDPKQASRLFEPFSQADSSTTRAFGGTGLGLAISQQLVTLMGGTIAVDGEPGVGTSFTFTVRVGIAAQGGQWSELDRVLEGKGLLVVDDNATNREILEAHASAWGMPCWSAASGAEALATLSRVGDGIDVAILDMDMPGMDGAELAHRIRETPAFASLPLLLLSSVGIGDGSRPLGDFERLSSLAKPARQVELYVTLADLLGITTRVERPAPLEPVRAGDGSSLDADVLLAEDNPVNQEVALTMLEMLGCRVTVVENGLDAVRLATSRRFDAVLMDCQMPRLDGFGATAQIREREQEHRTPILALTANAIKGDRERCLDAGMDDYLAKPFTHDELFRCLVRWLPAHEAGPDAPEATGRSREAEVPDEESPLDAQALDGLRKLGARSGRDVIGRIAEAYFGHAPGLVATLREAVVEDDGAALTRAAHSLKGASANVAALALADQARELERMGRQTGTKDAEPLVAALEAEFERVCRALRKEIA